MLCGYETERKSGSLSLKLMQQENYSSLLLKINKGELLKQRRYKIENTRVEAFYKLLKYLRQFVLVAYILMVFFRQPFWLNKPLADFPTSGITYISLKYYVLIQCLFLLFLVWVKVIKAYYIREPALFKRTIALFILGVVTVFSSIRILLKQNQYDPDQNLDLLVRPIFITIYNRRIRRTVKIYLAIFLQNLKLISLYLFNLFLFSSFGFLLFKNLKDPNGNQIRPFNDFWDGLYNMMVLQTTSNFPDVMLPYYKINRLSCIYFISFLIINYMIVTNLILAVFYSSYKQQLQSYLQEQINQKLEQKRPTQQDRPVVILLQNFKQKLEEDLARRLQTQLDTLSEQSPHKKQQIQNFYQNYRKNLQFFFKGQITKLSLKQVSNDNNQQNSASTSMLQTIFQSKWYQWTISLICLGLFYLFVIKENDQNFLLFDELSIGLNTFFLIESLLKIRLYGRQIFKRYFDLQEIFIAILLFALNTLVLVDDGVNYLKYLMILRTLRVFRLIKADQFLGRLFTDFFDFIPLLIQQMAVLFMVFLTFSFVGTSLFGGQIQTSMFKKVRLPKPLYLFNNFNDVPGSFLILLELMVVNNWCDNVQTYQIIFQSKLVRLFFVGFYIVTVLLCFNILIAVIIERVSRKYGDLKKRL